MREYGFHATLFVATRPVDRNLRAYMSWDQLREWQAAGFGIGSQTQTHPHMHRLSVDANREELRVSNDRFLAELGFRPSLFAYPYGEYNLDVIRLVREAGFEAAFGQNSGVAHGYDGFYELPRFAMNEQYGNRERLELAINGLPLKVDEIIPEDVVLTENPPLYGFTLAPDMDQERQLRCFNSKYGKLDVSIIGRRAEIRNAGAVRRQTLAGQLHDAGPGRSLAMVRPAVPDRIKVSSVALFRTGRNRSTGSVSSACQHTPRRFRHSRP